MRQRTISFWNAYYRDRLSRDDYPGFKLLEEFDRVVRHEARKPGRQLKARALNEGSRLRFGGCSAK